jgi:hypothetical protein
MVGALNAGADGCVRGMVGWVNLRLIKTWIVLLRPSNDRDNRSRPNREQDLNSDVYMQVNTYSLEIGTTKSELLRQGGYRKKMNRRVNGNFKMPSLRLILRILINLGNPKNNLNPMMNHNMTPNRRMVEPHRDHRRRPNLRLELSSDAAAPRERDIDFEFRCGARAISAFEVAQKGVCGRVIFRALGLCRRFSEAGET